MRKRKPVFTVKEKTEEELKGYSQLNTKLNEGGSTLKPVKSKEPVITGGIWTDDDLAELVRLVKKYPVGTLSRWEIIAEQMNRSVPEVTFMAARLKETGYRQNDSVAEAIVQETVKKVKRVVESNPVQKAATESVWSQEQQKLLETAIVKYPKNAAGDRWQKIANNIPGKTKEECLARYKYLVEIVKAQKAAANNAGDSNKESVNNVTENQNDEIEVTKENKRDEIQERTEQIEEGTEEIEPPQPVKKSGGKPRNKRKERKKRMEFSSDEDEVIDDLE